MFYVANWKCNLDYSSINNFILNFQSLYSSTSDNEVIIAASYPYLNMLNSNVDRKFNIAAQDVSYLNLKNATGEVSASMLKDIGVEYVIIGHSERRRYFGETKEILLKKVENAHKAGINVIFCIGESEHQRKEDNFYNILKSQLQIVYKNLNSSNLMIAYEPVWAIGTGVNASEEEIQNVVDFLRLELDCSAPILYGGSVNSNNAKKLKQIKGLGGFLIGSASLAPNSFIKIINT